MTRFTTYELVQINRELAKIGERICPGCYARHPLTPEYWYQTTPKKGRDAGKTITMPRCRTCTCAEKSESGRKRMKRPEVRARKTETDREWRHRNREVANAHARKYKRNRKLRKLQQVQELLNSRQRQNAA